MPNKVNATVAILTRNSAATLPHALEGVKDFSEIIVCDGNSTDTTRDIAARYGARMIEQDRSFLDDQGRIVDYAGVRNQTLDAASNDAFFFLDSDEYVDTTFVAAIRAAIEQKEIRAFWVNRKYVHNGVVIEYATTYPNRQMRFFFRSSAHRFIKRIHERIELRDGVEAGSLMGVLFVPFDMTIGALRAKWRYQAGVEVQRVGSLSIAAYVIALLSYMKVSLLYALRHIRILALGRTPRMPFLFEMERHMQHVRLATALLRIVKIG